MAAILSIGHRISGLLLFFSLPFWWYLASLALHSEQGFVQAANLLNQLPVKLALVVLMWSITHHFLAGIRYMLIDVHVGVEKAPARMSAWLVSLLALGLSAIAVFGWLL